MKTKDILFVAAFLFAVLAIVYLVQNKAKMTSADDNTPIDPAPSPPYRSTDGPPGQAPTERPVLYDTETGEGGAAVQQRMKSLWNNATTRNEITGNSGLLNRVYAGLTYPDGTKNAMAGIFGSSSAIPLAPVTIEPAYSRRVKEWQNVPDFETLTATSGIETAFSAWKNALDLKEVGLNFWPPNLPALIEAREFGAINRGDKNRSEKYREFTNDMRVLGDNIAYANTQIDEIVKDRAIADLRAAGWKFIGFDVSQPSYSSAP